MRYRQLGSTDLYPSVIGVSCQAAGRPAELVRAVHAALDLGINLFATSGDEAVETALGEALRARPGQALVAVTVDAAGPDALEEAVAGCLRRLGADRVDLLQLVGAGALPELVAAAQRLRDQGLIRHFGLAAPDGAGASLAEAAGVSLPAALQVRYSVLERQAEEVLLPFCHERRIGVVAAGPLTARLQAGQGDAGGLPEPVRQLVSDRRTLRQAMLQFVLAHPAVSIALPDLPAADQVAELAGAVYAPVLTREELALIDAACPPRGAGPAQAFPHG